MSKSLSPRHVDIIRDAYETFGETHAVKLHSELSGADMWSAARHVNTMAREKGWDNRTTLDRVMERRSAVERRIMDAVAHLPRDRQLSTVMSWMSIDDLERASETICKE